MLKDITLGQYVSGNSVVHRSDPRTKILLTFLYILSVFFVENPIFYIFTFIYLFFVAHFSKLSWRMLLRGVKPLRILLLITFVLNLFFSSGTSVLFKIGSVAITQEGLFIAIHFCLRLIFLILGTSILTLTTSPVSLSDGLELLFNPLKKIKFPVHELAMMMTIALRFIPTLMEETDKIIKAQKSRGAGFDNGSIINRAKAMIPLLVPLFVSAFRRANDLSMAMEARCYHGGEGRTRFRILRFSKADTYCISVSIAYVLVIVFTRGLITF